MSSYPLSLYLTTLKLGNPGPLWPKYISTNVSQTALDYKLWPLLTVYTSRSSESPPAGRVPVPPHSRCSGKGPGMIYYSTRRDWLTGPLVTADSTETVLLQKQSFNSPFTGYMTSYSANWSRELENLFTDITWQWSLHVPTPYLIPPLIIRSLNLVPIGQPMFIPLF